MRYPDGGGLTAEQRKSREEVRMRAVDLFEEGAKALSRCWVRDCLMMRRDVVGPRSGPVFRPWWAGWQRR
jgi:hypothetical protein